MLGCHAVIDRDDGQLGAKCEFGAELRVRGRRANHPSPAVNVDKERQAGRPVGDEHLHGNIAGRSRHCAVGDGDAFGHRLVERLETDFGVRPRGGSIRSHIWGAGAAAAWAAIIWRSAATCGSGMGAWLRGGLVGSIRFEWTTVEFAAATGVPSGRRQHRGHQPPWRRHRGGAPGRLDSPARGLRPEIRA